MCISVAQVYGSQGKHNEAVELYQKALAIKIKTLGEEHPSVADTYNNFANVSHVTVM